MAPPAPTPALAHKAARTSPDPVALNHASSEAHLATLTAFIDTQKSYIDQIEALAPWDSSFGVDEHALIERAKRDQEMLVLIKEAGALQSENMDKTQKKEWERLMEIVQAFEEMMVRFVGLAEGFVEE